MDVLVNVPVKAPTPIMHYEAAEAFNKLLRVEGLRGSYRDENIDTPVRGRYLTDLTLEDALQCL